MREKVLVMVKAPKLEAVMFQEMIWLVLAGWWERRDSSTNTV
jgi:hypothetical protein